MLCFFYFMGDFQGSFSSLPIPAGGTFPPLVTGMEGPKLHAGERVLPPVLAGPFGRTTSDFWPEIPTLQRHNQAFHFNLFYNEIPGHTLGSLCRVFAPMLLHFAIRIIEPFGLERTFPAHPVSPLP